MKRDYFLTDLDGTLLRSNAKPSDYTVSVLTQALDQGTVVSYATARSYQSSNAVVSEIPWRYPLVLYNGAMLFDPIAKRVLGGRWLDSERSNAIVKIGKTFGITPLLFALDEQDYERVLHESWNVQGIFNSWLVGRIIRDSEKWKNSTVRNHCVR